jgi:hypothetical protein
MMYQVLTCEVTRGHRDPRRDDCRSAPSSGEISAKRVHLFPTLGTATERHVIKVQDRTNRLCELVDGVLEEKVMGFDETRFAVLLASFRLAEAA